MENLKDLLTPARFSLFGYTVAVLLLSTGVVFVGITSKLRTSERRKFLCDFRDSWSGMKFYQADCFEKYEQQHNSPFPLYLFVLLSFASVLIVCLVYSWCCVKSRVDKLEAAMKTDAENPRPRPRIRSRRIFCFYLLQLTVRLVLGIALMLSQNLLLYPSGFSVKFVCVLPTKAKSNTTYDQELTARCHNPVASEKATLLTALWIVHAIFAFLVFGEMVYLATRAAQSPSFTFDSEFCAKHFFHKSASSMTPIGFRKRMKTRTAQQTELLEPLIHCNRGNEEERTHLDDIFLDVIIYTGRAREEFLKECQTHMIYDFYLKPESQLGSVAINKRSELFLSNIDAQKPKKILVVGRPGIGKSLLCQRLMRDWSRGELFGGNAKRFTYAFLLLFRSFFSESAERISLRQLLSRAVHLEGDLDDHVFQELLDHPEKILLVFDGLDEFKDHERCTENDASRFGNSSMEQIPASALYMKLLQGKLLPEATVLTTSRPTVLGNIGISSFDRTVEIMGFTEEKVHKYVKNYCKQDEDETTKTRIWEHIHSNLNLLSLCYIPVNCRIICFFLNELIKLHCQDSITLPTRLTDIYQGALRLLIFKHHPAYRKKPFQGNERFSESVEQDLTNLGALARKGIAEGRMIFDSEEVATMKNCGLLNQMPDSRVSPVEFKQCFCFIHLTLQEFLAAREIVKMDPDRLKQFIDSNAEDPKWHLVIQFVAGLLCGQQSEAVNSLINCLHKSFLSSPTTKAMKMALLMMKCLYEYNDDATVMRAAYELQKNNKFQKAIELSWCQVSPVECTAIAYFLKHFKSLEYKLNLGGNSIADGGCRELAKLLKEGGPIDLNITENKITDQGLISLTEAMGADSCKLKTLNISLNNLINSNGFRHLWESIKKGNCKLVCLRLGGEQLTENVVSQLSEALEHANCKLISLRLQRSDDAITDKTLLRLCQALKHQNCRLSSLRIKSHKITNQGVKYICEALENQNCKLTNLWLISNRITAVVVPYVCKALRNENCKLTTLDITSWNIKRQNTRDLEEAIEAKRRGCLTQSTETP